MAGIWEHEGNVENMSHGQAFSTFLECSRMSRMFYHSIIGFFIFDTFYIYTSSIASIVFSSFALCCRGNVARTIKHAFSMFYTLKKKTWVFDQSEGAHGPIYVIIHYKACKKVMRHQAGIGWKSS